MRGFLMWSCTYNKKAQHVAVEIINSTGQWLQGMSSQNRKWIICSRKLGIISQATKRSLEYSKDTSSIPACCWQGFSRSSMPQHKTAFSQLILSHWRENKFGEVPSTCAIIKVWISKSKGMGKMDCGLSHMIRLADHLLNFLSHTDMSVKVLGKTRKSPQTLREYTVPCYQQSLRSRYYYYWN